MVVALSMVRDALDGWILATAAVLLLWIWQRRIRYEGPPVLTIEPDEDRLEKQKAFIKKTDRLRRYMLGFGTASVALGIATIIAWLHQHVR